jgi:hypothetical protein
VDISVSSNINNKTFDRIQAFENYSETRSAILAFQFWDVNSFFENFSGIPYKLLKALKIACLHANPHLRILLVKGAFLPKKQRILHGCVANVWALTFSGILREKKNGGAQCPVKKQNF